MAKGPVPVGILITVAFLALYGAAGIWLGWKQHQWLLLATAVLAALTSVMAARLVRWSRYGVYALTFAFACNFMVSIYRARHVGYFSLWRWQQNVFGLVPESLLLLLAAFCCYMAYRHFGRSAWAKPV